MSVVGVVGIVNVLDEDVIDEVVVVGVGCYIVVKMADQTSSVVIVVFLLSSCRCIQAGA